MITVNEKMTAIADAIREQTGEDASQKYSLDSIASFIKNLPNKAFQIKTGAITFQDGTTSDTTEAGRYYAKIPVFSKEDKDYFEPDFAIVCLAEEFSDYQTTDKNGNKVLNGAARSWFISTPNLGKFTEVELDSNKLSCYSVHTRSDGNNKFTSNVITDTTYIGHDDTEQFLRVSRATSVSKILNKKYVWMVCKFIGQNIKTQNSN